ncbi:MAG: helix-turn-helix domain-containing protein [Tildeniella nuda ZEHNDER 1965/U140]|nr:helix-turn-helix domain-containing protein [Tildeniella nuda ZEHNDER 1965/U140]
MDNGYDARHVLPKMPLKKPYLIKQPEVGHFVRALRQLTGLTQGQFANQLGVTYEGSMSSLPIPNCPHPLTPSPKGGEGEPNRIEVPLPFGERDLG